MEVNAVQYGGERDHHLFPEGLCRSDQYCWATNGHPMPWFAHIHRLEGVMRVSKGDWIVGPGAEGEYWPVKDSIFQKTYDRVEECFGYPSGD
jgi:hypothetical protein